MKKLFAAMLVAIVAATATIPVIAADPTPAAASKQKKPRAIPFYGNIGVVDKQANTIRVGKRTFQVTPDTRVLKDGKTATLKEAAPGDEVGGSYRNEGGTLALISLRIGPKPDPKANGK